MKKLIGLAALLLTTATACSGADGTVATDPAPTGQAVAVPTPVPATPARVRTRGLVTVIDAGSGTTEVCVGPVATSLPPQCGGPQLVGWDWATNGAMSERRGGVRWGLFALTGAWDGTRLTVTDSVPAALYDAAMVDPVALPTPSTSYAEKELAAIADTLRAEVPGFLSGSTDDQGQVLVGVTYDDGSLQAQIDQKYGAGVVLVTSALVDLG